MCSFITLRFTEIHDKYGKKLRCPSSRENRVVSLISVVQINTIFECKIVIFFLLIDWFIICYGIFEGNVLLRTDNMCFC